MLSRPSPKFLKFPSVSDRLKAQVEHSRALKSKRARERRFGEGSNVCAGSAAHVILALQAPHKGLAVMQELLEYVNYEKSALPWTSVEMVAILNQCAQEAPVTFESTSTFLDLVTCVFHPHAGLYTEPELMDMLLSSSPMLDVLHHLMNVPDVDPGSGQYFAATTALVLRDIASCGHAAAHALCVFHQPFAARAFLVVDSNPGFPLWAHVVFLEEVLLRLPPSDIAASVLLRFLLLAFRKDINDPLFRSNVMRSIANLVFTFQDRDYFVAAVNDSEFIPQLMRAAETSRNSAEVEAALVLYTELVSCKEAWASDNDCTAMLLALLQSPHLPMLQTTMLWVINSVLGTLSVEGSLRLVACKPLLAWVVHVSAQLAPDNDDKSFAFQCLRACLYDDSFGSSNPSNWYRLVELAVSEGVVDALLASLAVDKRRASAIFESSADFDLSSNRDCLRLARAAFPTLLAHLYPEFV